MPANILAGSIEIAPDGTLVFPVQPGMTLEFTSRPTFATIIQDSPLPGNTARIGLDPFPLWEYDIDFGYVSDDPAYNVDHPIKNPARMTQFEQIIGLFCAVGGRRDTFMFDLAQLTKKPLSSLVQGIQIGVGDGTNVAFQLIRSVGPFLDLVDNPVTSSIVVTVAPGTGSPFTATVVGESNGLIALSAPPPLGAVVSASFRWIHRMRFVNDSDDYDSMCDRLYMHGKLKIIQERNVPA